jgi:signal transduction histidine kinase
VLTVGLLVATCVVAGLDTVLATAGRQAPAFYVLEIGAAVVWGAVGALAVVVRPDRRAGRLMQLLGLVLAVNAPAGFVFDTENGWIAADFVLARFVQPVQIPLFAHLLLAYPDGRLTGRAPRRLLGAAYCLAAGVGVFALAGAAILVDRPGWTTRVPPAGIAGSGSSVVVNLAWLALTLGFLVLFVRKIRRATVRERRILAYPLGAGGLLLLLFLVTTGITVAGGQSPVTETLSAVIAYLAVVAMPGAFLAGLMRARLSYGSVADLVRTIERAPVGQLQPALRKALRDPGLVVAFARDGAYVSEGGEVVAVPDTLVALPIGGDPPVALVLHDPSLTDEPKLLAAASAATRLALDNFRLHALVREQLAEVRASRRRIIEAGVEQRRRLERDLHDGAQQRMLAVGIVLQLLAQRLGEDHDAAGLLEEATTELRAAVDELRELARGIHPAVLTEHGLPAAVRALARRIPIPVTAEDGLPRRPADAGAEAAAYFAVSEALTNVVKHSGATNVHIGLSMSDDRLRVEVVDDGAGGADPGRGSGLRGLVDRAAAFDGTVSVTDAVPNGTRIVVELRCD